VSFLQAAFLQAAAAAAAVTGVTGVTQLGLVRNLRPAIGSGARSSNRLVNHCQ
jgi:hypothetical protein